MRTIRRILVVALVAAVILPLLHANAQTPVEINFYFPEATANNAQAIFEEYAAKFSEQYPNIKVNVAIRAATPITAPKFRPNCRPAQDPTWL